MAGVDVVYWELSNKEFDLTVFMNNGLRGFVLVHITVY